ncbi:amidohydrolase [Kordiimonas lacus]|uniref:Amidohydrolase 3 domain-containing protein n=1 Tax=Kordiimonas lacus TaxID=637679 RepID=A0A1G7BIM9_9PROT|nr:amidohydrolase [Kordiimonas lacus]SDE26580.1 hypothetical protein SAMN04488071_2523 [Kordiimonas lacus]
MNPLKSIFTAGALLLVAACGQGPDATESADRVFTHGQVWTGGDAAGVDAEAFAVKDGRILAVGASTDMAAYIGDGTEVVDLQGAFVVPGLIDNHVHFFEGSFTLTQVQLRDAATPEEFTRRIAEAAAKAPAGTWVLGGNWDHELWGGELPDRAWIDEVTGDVPVSVNRLDGHMVLANSKALELAGIDATTPDPEGGVIVRDADGRPTGVLKDAAMFMMDKAVPKPSDARMEEVFKMGMAYAAKMGVTQVHDMAYNYRSLETYRRLKDRDELALRIYAFTPLEEWQRMQGYVAEHGRGDDMLRWGGLKGFVDGALGSTTAWMYEPYADAPETSGFPLLSMNELQNRVFGGAQAGLHVTVHGIGFQANDKLLDIFENVAARVDRTDLRFRIEHAQHLSESAIKRFSELDVTASMHPYHLIDDGRWAVKRLGEDRLKGTYAIGSLMRAGGRVTFGSDWPVAPLDPIMGIYAAVTRQTLDGANPDGWIPDEKISVLEALRAYTVNNAYAGYQEDKLGLIKPGYLADFVVLSDNLFAIDPVAIKDVSVLRTAIGGVDRYRAED